VPWYGDPDVLDAHARGLAADADAVRARARALEASTTAMRWQGPAAQAFRATVERDAARLHRAAAELDEAAAALRAHADEVRATLAQIRALERAVVGWFEARAQALGGALQDVAAWGWRTAALPGSGDRAWLGVAADLRARGVRL
jgi:uncharacterized protein YukE